MTKCGASHPDKFEVTCFLEYGLHPDHMGEVEDFDVVIWPNEACIPQSQKPYDEYRQLVRLVNETGDDDSPYIEL